MSAKQHKMVSVAVCLKYLQLHLHMDIFLSGFIVDQQLSKLDSKYCILGALHFRFGTKHICSLF